MRKPRVRHGIVALLLLVTMPLRVFAMVVMPCCPVVEQAAGHHATHDGSMNASGAMSDAHEGGDHVHATPPTCCTAALTSTPVVPSLIDYVPPHGRPQRATAIAAFPTDPPERPPRGIA